MPKKMSMMWQMMTMRGTTGDEQPNIVGYSLRMALEVLLGVVIATAK